MDYRLEFRLIVHQTTQNAQHLQTANSKLILGGEDMDWQKQMNQAMAYIECHLIDHIDYTSMAKIVGFSEWEFRRMFSFLAQMPLSEYIRRRRLGASLEGIKTGETIIEIHRNQLRKKKCVVESLWCKRHVGHCRF